MVNATRTVQKESKKRKIASDGIPKAKKSKKHQAVTEEPDQVAAGQVVETPKKSKKSKKLEQEREVHRAQSARDSDTQPKSSKMKSSNADVDRESPINEVPAEITDPVEEENAVTRFRISTDTRAKLADRGIRTLFPIQCATFDPIFDGMDVVGRARTGTGKTLSFALPVVERLLLDPSTTLARGRSARCLVLCPTRELAKQVANEFASVSGPFRVLTVYGGVPYWDQESAFRDGVDIVVGTPGRVQDHLERGNLRLDAIQFAILDEADQMLDIGFADAMERILAQIRNCRGDTASYQTLLFSATLPEWIGRMVKKFLRPANTTTIDLVGSQILKTSETIQHYALQCFWSQRREAIPDVVRVYGSGTSGRVIIFTETKNEANEMALDGDGLDCQVLHGDIAQKQREITLQSFREGKCRVLVATDVAARGLDIPEVDLVIQCQPPKDVDTFVHRSGRTGRAGKSGTCITFFKPDQEYALKLITRKTGVQFKRIGPPQTADIIMASAKSTLKNLNKIHDSVVPLFKQLARAILDGEETLDILERLTEKEEKQDGIAENILALCLAALSGHTKPPPSRSLITCQSGLTTMAMTFPYEIKAPSYVRSILQKQIPEIGWDEWRGFRMLKDSKGCVFELAFEKVEDAMAKWETRCTSPTTVLTVLTELPELVERDGPNGRPMTNQRSNASWGTSRNGYGRSPSSNRDGYRGGSRGGRGFGGRGSPSNSYRK